MKKESPTTYRVGSLREFAEWTKSVVRDPRSADGVPEASCRGDARKSRKDCS